MGDYTPRDRPLLPGRKFPLYLIQAYPLSESGGEGKTFSYAFTAEHRPVEIKTVSLKLVYLSKKLMTLK